MPWAKRTTAIVAASAGAGLVLWWLLGSDEEGGFLGRLRQLLNDAVNTLVQKGARLTHCPYDTATGVVPCDPQALADSTTYDVQTLALARAIASEEGRGDPSTWVAVGWALKNLASAHFGGDIVRMLTTTKEPSHAGKFGTQKNIDRSSAYFGHSDRRASTAADPYDGHAQIALAIQNGTIQDTTGGAIEFDRPASDDNPEQVAINRAAEGLVAVDLGIPGLRFWAPA